MSHRFYQLVAALKENSLKGTNTMDLMKIRNGTRSDATDLCRTCRNSVIIQGSRDSDERRYCDALSGDSTQLFTNVADCSSYYNKSLPSLHQYEKIAWVLETSKGRQVGFVPAKEWREKNRHMDMVPEGD